jgi:oligopeptide/dipeptide ABC transporter ATP-binding protein
MSVNVESSGVVFELRNLRSRIDTQRGPVYPVNDVTLECHRGRTLAVVGESGSGKSMTFLSALGLLPAGGVIESGEMVFDGRTIDTTNAADRRRLRGKSIGMIFQDALAGLNPAFTIGQQISDVIRYHDKVSRKVARAQAIETLGLVGIPQPTQRIDYYPHQLSGGMRQRVMIAMGIALRPQVLVADEPTTALDVTVQAQIMELLDGLRSQLGMSLVIITHDLGVVARYAEEVAVMYSGRVVERGTVGQILQSSVHPYTRALRASTPRPDAGDVGLNAIPGQPPSIRSLPTGCSFHPRCALAHGRTDCAHEVPVLRRLAADGQLTACHHAEELLTSSVREGVSV